MTEISARCTDTFRVRDTTLRTLPLSLRKGSHCGTINVSLPAGKNCEVFSILFSDIKQFSQVVDTLSIETSVNLLNDYYARLLPKALQRGGELRDYLGDGMYISFGQDSLEIPAYSAVDAAFDMMREFALLIESWKKIIHFISQETVQGIGIATGAVYKGLMGHANARKEKLVGPSVNKAAHLCEEAKKAGGGVFICPKTAALLDPAQLQLTEIPTLRGNAFRIAFKQ